MPPLRTRPDLFSRPRIAIAGLYRSPLSAEDGGFVATLSRSVNLHVVAASPTPVGLLRLLRDGARAIMQDRCEAVHLLDARLAPAALMLRARFGVPVSVTLARSDAGSGRRIRPWLSPVQRLDEAFTSDRELARAFAQGTGQLPVTVTAPAAEPLPEPSKARLASMVRLLHDITPGRLIVAVPRPLDSAQARWFRDAVAPLLHGNPVCLLLGAPGRREARLFAGAIGLRGSMRVHAGTLDADTIAAAARCADVFAVPGKPQYAGGIDDLLLALIASKVPVVAGGAVRGAVLDHERNAFAVDPCDAMDMVFTLNKLMALPAVQRHYLGEEFAANALSRWTWDTAVKTYAERFAALVGRPQIPAELRAA
jgi:hypothetical protein